MVEVYFESKKEAAIFCDEVNQYHQQIRIHQQKSDMWGMHLKVEGSIRRKVLLQLISNAMVKVLLEEHLSDMLIRTITEKYYFTEAEEINRIYDFSMWILFESDRDSKKLREHVEVNKLLQPLFLDYLEQHTIIHFSSIRHFRLAPFWEFVKQCIEKAIEEFKREEDHQAFVDMLRSYIENKTADVDIVYVEQGDCFTFYNKNKEKISKDELTLWMKKAPLYALGLHENEFDLSPLIAMAPAKIKIYGSNPAEPKTITVRSIFQERVEFEKHNSFIPYTRQ